MDVTDIENALEALERIGLATPEVRNVTRRATVALLNVIDVLSPGLEVEPEQEIVSAEHEPRIPNGLHSEAVKSESRRLRRPQVAGCRSRSCGNESASLYKRDHVDGLNDSGA